MTTLEGIKIVEDDIENVRVAVRIRPFSAKEESNAIENIVCFNREHRTLVLINPKVRKYKGRIFRYDHIFAEDSIQMDVYQKVALPIVNQLFKGYNGTIFAYGQTGSGKTFTMSGNPKVNELKGIIPNTFSHIFSEISRASEDKSFVVTATYIEIYNENIHDLLSVHPNDKLQLREHPDIGVYIRDLTGFTVDSIDAITKIMNIGNMNRSTRSTLMNQSSSRSHAIFTIVVEAMDRESNTTTVAKLNLVDLAGSERVKRSQVTGMALKEATNINQSLFVLSNVICALVEEEKHIPYRNSKLTRLLQDSLGGNSKTAMIATISPCGTDYEESICTLRYASRAKLIKNHVHLNIQTDTGLIESFQQEISRLQAQLENISIPEEIKPEKVKKIPAQSSKSSEKHKIQAEELLNMEKIKNELIEKIALIQNKILTGGQDLYDKALKQQFLLETTVKEINDLDLSHLELEELLKETSFRCEDIGGQVPNLDQENLLLDLTISVREEMVDSTTRQNRDANHEHKHEIKKLKKKLDHNVGECQFATCLVKSFVPHRQLERIKSMAIFNKETEEYSVPGVAYLGNYLDADTPQRKFTRNIPTSRLMEFRINQEKYNMRKKEDPIPEKTKNEYLQYGDTGKKENN